MVGRQAAKLSRSMLLGTMNLGIKSQRAQRSHRNCRMLKGADIPVSHTDSRTSGLAFFGFLWPAALFRDR